MKRLRLALWAILAAGVVASPLWLPLLMRRMAFFRVRRIEILGARYVPPSDILARLHVDTTASVWDPAAPLARRVESHPGIRSAVVHRKLPGTIIVDVTERWPIALVPTAGGLRAYDAAGHILPLDPTRAAVDAPVIAEPDTTLLRLLGDVRAGLPNLYGRLSAARRLSNGASMVDAAKRQSRNDELLLEMTPTPVRTMADVSLERLAEIDPVETDLARRQVRATEIDLRYHDQVIARLP